MITQNELYDLSFILSLIRSDIHSPKNVEILDALLALLERSDILIENNQIRHSLCQIPQLNENWEFLKYQNYYVRTIVFKDFQMQTALFKNLSMLKSLLQSRKFDQALDLADAVHALPDIIADNNGKIPKNYYKTFARPYEMKWKSKLC